MEVRTSKQLSYLLRHGAVKEGLRIRSDGYVKLEQILQRDFFRNNRIDESIIRQIVTTNDKKRFELMEEEDENGKLSLFIRASQGHSIANIDDEKLLRKVQTAAEFPLVVHGTYLRNWESIKSNGLRTMKRNHVHFAPGYPDDGNVISGMRSTCQVFIEIDLERALAAGMDFFVSENNVLLSRGFDGAIPPTFFKRVTDINGKLLN